MEINFDKFLDWKEGIQFSDCVKFIGTSIRIREFGFDMLVWIVGSDFSCLFGLVNYSLYIVMDFVE